MYNRKKGHQDPEKGGSKTKSPELSSSRSPSSFRLAVIRGAGLLLLVGLLIFAFKQFSSPKKSYAVVIDAGSTGSRIHAYEFQHVGGAPKLVDELFVQLKPGLSSFAQNPDGGAKSLQPLLEKALGKIPKNFLSSTPVMIGATAGLRMLPGNQASDLLEASRKLLRADYNFKDFPDNAVSIMSGSDEGKFAWLAVNMLIGKLGSKPKATVGVIDLGGGSVQMMRALEPPTAATAPRDYVTKTAWQGKKYNLYVHSFLGYGLKAGRMAVLKQQGSNSCIPIGGHAHYNYNNDQVDVEGDNLGSSFDRCQKAAVQALNVNKPCEVVTGCAFDGNWGALPADGDTSGEFYLLSYLYERIEQAGAGKFEADEGIGIATVGELAEAARKVCSMPLHEVKASNNVHPEDPLYFCLDLSYIHALLTEGFGITSSFKMAKKFDINDVKYEAAWSLGAALEML
ncbi:hypothetical protein AAMO2058_000491800 [Amorphochlora amoebiformis]